MVVAELSTRSAVVWPANGVLLKYHWYWSGADPLAPTLNIAVPPLTVLIEEGWLMIPGGALKSTTLNASISKFRARFWNETRVVELLAAAAKLAQCQ